MTRVAEQRGILAREQQVLLLLGGEATDDELIALLRCGVDWDVMLVLAGRERAAAELYRRVRPLLGVDVPSSAMATLQRLAMVSDFEMLHLAECLRETIGVVEAFGARAMLLKGAALVHGVHGGVFARRPMSDIDLLVDRPRAAEIQRALVGGGRWVTTVSTDGERVYDDHHHLPPLRDARGSNVYLELHTALFPDGHPFGLTADLVWQEAEPVGQCRASGSASGYGAYAPSLPHQLLHACLHFAWSHAMKFGAWRAFRDVGAIVASNRIEWDAFVRLARETRATTACYWTFRLAASAAGIDIPTDVRRALRPPRPEMYLRGLERHYLLNLFPSSQSSPSVRLDRALWDMGMLPAWSGHGTIRPWDRDVAFLGVAHGPRATRRADANDVWRAVLYLRAVMGSATLPRNAYVAQIQSESDLPISSSRRIIES